MTRTTAQREYENFDVIVTKQDATYTIQAGYSRGGEDKVSRRTFPLDSPEFQNLLGALATLTGDLDQAEAAGKLMREHLFPGDIWALFTSKWSLAERDGKGLRLRLRIEPPEISMLPWEYCFDKDYDFFATRLDTPVVRYIDLPFTPEGIRAPRPTRVLLATASPSGWDALDVEAEAAQIRAELQGLDDVEVEVLPHLKWDELQLHLKTFQPHVLHFIGHGEFDISRGRGRLVLERPDGSPHKIRAKQLATQLRARGVQVVVLNACKTAAHSRGSAFMGIAPALVRAEIPAVIAMQFAIPDETARRFAQQLYRYLALGDPLDRAITEARINVSGYDEVFWAIPVLFMRAPDGVIWRPREEREVVEPTVTQPARLREEHVRPVVDTGPRPADVARSKLGQELEQVREREQALLARLRRRQELEQEKGRDPKRELEIALELFELPPMQELKQELERAREREQELTRALEQTTERDMAEVDKSELRRRMVAAFDPERLEVLCDDINSRLKREGSKVRVSPAIVGGRGLEAIILNLIGYLDRRGLLHHLIEAIREDQPGLI